MRARKERNERPPPDAARESDDDSATEFARRGMPVRKLYAFLVKLALRHPWLLGASIIASFLVAMAGIAAVSLVVPFMETLSPDAAAVSGDLPLNFLAPLFEGLDAVGRIQLIALLLVGLTFVRGVMVYGESRLSSYLRIRMDRDLREQLYDEMMRVEVRHLQRERVGNLQTLLNTYPRRAADIVDQYISVLNKTVTATTYIVVLLMWQPLLTILALVLGGASLLAVQGINAAVKRNARVTNELRVRLNQTSLESIQGMRLIRFFGREESMRERYGRNLRTFQRQSFRGASMMALIPPVQSLVNISLVAALLYAATLMLPAGDGTGWVVALTVFVVITARLTAPLQSFSKRRAKITSELPALEEIVRFLETPKPFLAEGTSAFDGLREGVRFEHVDYAYSAESGPVLRDVSIEIPRGSTVAIVGSSGSGKSTLLALLARLSDPTSGRVSVDGRDLRDLDSTTWRRKLAVVSQENFLFNDTVRNNLRFPRPEASDEEIVAAAKKARAHEFILALEEGYDTILGDRGTRLSGGQAQRLAIARALIADPEILVLDEATSALDTNTERDVQDALESAARGRTVIMVAHRLSTIRKADRIYVLEAGRVVEQGTHEQLLAQEGHYTRYVALQDLTGARPPTARPLRLVLDPQTSRARLINGATVADAIPVSVVGIEGSRDALLATPGDRVLLEPGVPHALVRVGAQLHERVPTYALGKDGRELRVRAAPPSV